MMIQKALVLGAGVMGAAIAAHLANAGIQTYLLDLTGKTNRNQMAEDAIQRLLNTKPSPLFIKENVQHIIPGNFEDDLYRVQEVDWVIEAVVEKLDVKKALVARVEKYWQEGTIVTTNTSGLSIDGIVEGRSPAFCRSFFGTHFFNPPRYMKLLELIPGKHTDRQLMKSFQSFAEMVLGKGVVIARDTPNFIANRIGVYGLLVTIEEMCKKNLSVEEVDALTGTLIGRPKSATFRTLDMVGLDTFIHVAHNNQDSIAIPDWFQEMADRGQIGEKSGRGFYWKKRGSGGSEIYVYNWMRKEYEPRKKGSLQGLETIAAKKELTSRLKDIFFSPHPKALFLWEVLKKTLLYAAANIPEIAEDPIQIDRAMKWGFNWELGPFEIWDALGLARAADRMQKEGEQLPAWVENLIARGKTSFYEKEGGVLFYHTYSGELKEEEKRKELEKIAHYRQKSSPVLKNPGASLYDVGDDVACLVFHSPNQAIGYDIIEMIGEAILETEKNYRGLIIHHDGTQFCVGANLMMVLMEAQNENWDELEEMVHRFQQANQAIKYCRKPVVAAPFGMTLGGGAEICLPAARIQAAAETYMGLVETGVGLIPAGGGCKEMLLRFTESVDELDPGADLQPFVNKAFETIALAKVSASGEEARKMGFLRKTDGITMNRDALLYSAKQSVLGLEKLNYQPPWKKEIRVVGRDGQGVLKLMIYTMKQGGWITSYDEKIARQLARVMSGGDVAANSRVSEQHLLDLEREAFLSLLGEPNTQKRMEYMLLKGKPLRN